MKTNLKILHSNNTLITQDKNNPINNVIEVEVEITRITISIIEVIPEIQDQIMNDHDNVRVQIPDKDMAIHTVVHIMDPMKTIKTTILVIIIHHIDHLVEIHDTIDIIIDLIIEIAEVPQGIIIDKVDHHFNAIEDNFHDQDPDQMEDFLLIEEIHMAEVLHIIEIHLADIIIHIDHHHVRDLIIDPDLIHMADIK